MPGCGCGCGCSVETSRSIERKALWILLGINAAMFFGELLFGWLFDSMGLVADSIDMFADAWVYGISLYAIGKSKKLQADAASTAGVLQFLLALGVLVEVMHRFFTGSEPVGIGMMVVSVTALAANVVCLVLIARHRDGGVHMRASWIFSKNDVIANVGVLISASLVWITGSNYPDLLIGAIIGVIVLRGGIQILDEAKAAATQASISCSDTAAPLRPLPRQTPPFAGMTQKDFCNWLT
ncbi:cation diffusion facilitator family transporter [Desulfatirhabdium butyrativorans]|uniref:cation diffusion facilitator family transporter n=1 Tax=Desulfatirhabdium butyrativorans TaxID=340467 RepID=UPI00040834D4|nr:cation diffusion facilitator family transporter [Desulfatirhabdium butyrativorans]